MRDDMRLRKITGAGILDCRAALDCTAGDLQKAEVLIRAQGTRAGLGHSLQTEARLRRLERAAGICLS